MFFYFSCRCFLYRLFGCWSVIFQQKQETPLLLLRSFQTKLRGWWQLSPRFENFGFLFGFFYWPASNTNNNNFLPAFVATVAYFTQQKQHSSNNEYTVSNFLVDLIEIKLNVAIYSCITCCIFFVMGLFPFNPESELESPRGSQSPSG